jgi:hypothetical protein
LVFTSGLGTLIFPYALVFLEHAVATFFAFLAFYLLFKAKQEKIKDNRYFLLAGLSSGFAITCSAITFLVALACFIYLLYYKKEKIYYFIIGGFIGILPFLIYNYATFETPFTLPRHNLDTAIWNKLGGIYGLQTPNPFVFLRLTLYPYKGLFFYYPVLILSFLGLYYMYKKFKIESILIIFVFLAFLIMNSSWWAWWGGTSFGPRHLTPIIPFIVLPLVYVFMNFDKNRIFKFIVFLLIFYSVFVNFVGLQPMYEEIIDIKTIDVATQYKDKINTFQILINPLYEYYMPLFLKDGSRSRIFESLINNQVLDIRFLLPDQREFFSSFYFYIPFLSLLPIILVILLIWYKEIFTDKIKTFFLKHKWLILILFILISSIILLLMPTKSKELSFGKMWYPQSPNEQGRWMKQDGQIIIYNSNDKDKLTSIHFYLQSYYKDRTIELYFNDEVIDNFSVFKEGSEIYTPILNLKPGKNILKFHSNDICTSIADITKTMDYRCVSIELKNITLLPYDKIDKKIDFLYNKNWYDKAWNEDVKWMNNNGTISLFYFNDSSKKVVLEFYFVPFIEKKTVYFYLNDNLLNVFDIVVGGWVQTPQISLKSGENTLKFYVKEECITVSNISKNNDNRCFNLGIKSLSLNDYRII